MFDIQLDDPAFKLNEQVDCRLSLLIKDVDWTLFDKHGRSLFLELFSVVILNLLSRKDSTLYAYALKTPASFVEEFLVRSLILPVPFRWAFLIKSLVDKSDS